MSEFNIHVNPHTPAASAFSILPPCVTKGPTNASAASHVPSYSVFSIDNEDGRAWFKETYDYELKSNNSEDLQLDDLVIENDMAFGCCPALRRLYQHCLHHLVVLKFIFLYASKKAGVNWYARQVLSTVDKELSTSLGPSGIPSSTGVSTSDKIFLVWSIVLLGWHDEPKWEELELCAQIAKKIKIR
jgi:hypothetical protein